MQIYLNISKKSQIINYKDNFFVEKLNILFLNFFLNFFFFFFSSSSALSKLLFVSLLHHHLIKNNLFFLNFKQFNNFFFSWNIKIQQLFNQTFLGTKPKKVIYPVLKSPFIYKKAFRHFAFFTYTTKILYCIPALGLAPLLTTNKVKLELLNSTKNTYLKEKQFFLIN